MSSYARNRLVYEAELAKLLTSEKYNRLGIRCSKSSMPWDVIAVATKKGGVVKNTVFIEVKTSKKETIRLNSTPRTKKQLARYKEIKSQYGTTTWYAFRYITRKELGGSKNNNIKTRWRFFSLYGIKDGKMKFSKGKTFDTFVRKYL